MPPRLRALRAGQGDDTVSEHDHAASDAKGAARALSFGLCLFALAWSVLAMPVVAQQRLDPRDPQAPRPDYEQGSHLKLARLAFEILPPGALRDELAADGESLLGDETGSSCTGADDSGGSLLEGDWEEDCNFHFLRHFWNPDSDSGLGGSQDALSYAEGTYRDAVALHVAGDRPGAWYELGRVLHLLQDLSNPAHVHLDPHGSADPSNNYEALIDQLFDELLDDGELDGLEPVDALALSVTPCPPGFADSPKQAQPLFRLFLFQAETSDFFESGDVAGMSDCVGGGETAASFAMRTGHAVAMAPPASGAFTPEHLEAHADVLLPLAVSAGAGLLELFWSDTHEDADGDGTPDGLDPCPDEAIDDADGDGACAGERYREPLERAGDACPLESTLLAPGACGCLLPDDSSDRDSDGVPDCLDLCPDTPDAGQDDTDRDGFGDACLLRLALGDGVSVAGGETVELSLAGRLGVACLGEAGLRVSFDAGRLGFEGVEGASGCRAEVTPVAVGELDLVLDCPSGVTGDVELLSLGFSTPPSGAGLELFTLELSQERAMRCNGAAVGLVARAGTIALGCLAGDLDGDGDADLADLLAARGLDEAACADLAPSSRSCMPRAGAAADCPLGDGHFDDADRAALRSLVAGITRSVCESCADEAAGGGRRLLGDVAPGGGDGLRDVSDVLALLRFVVGLEAPIGEERLRGDVTGDGVLDVADVLALLRDVVQLAPIDWPERELAWNLDAPATLSVWTLRVVGWPAWARVSGFAADHCPAAPFGGLDLAGTAAIYQA